MLKDLIKKNYEQFSGLCKSHNVKSLFAFGSSVTGNFRESSDVDLVVELNEKDPLKKGELLLSFWDKLEGFFKRKVDLLTAESIKNPVLKKEIEDTKQLIYAGKEGKILF